MWRMNMDNFTITAQIIGRKLQPWIMVHSRLWTYNAFILQINNLNFYYSTLKIIFLGRKKNWQHMSARCFNYIFFPCSQQKDLKKYSFLIHFVPSKILKGKHLILLLYLKVSSFPPHIFGFFFFFLFLISLRSLSESNQKKSRWNKGAQK